jgi:hypothetical protein
MDKDCYVDKPMLYWVIGIALTISASVIASSYNNQKRIEESLTNRQQKTDECILKMKEDISEIKTDIKWLNEMRKNGEIVIKNQTSFKVASSTKSQ